MAASTALPRAVTKYLAMLGKRGGSSRSEAKIAAVRLNIAKANAQNKSIDTEFALQLLSEYPPLTYQGIADLLGCSRQRIDQIVHEHNLPSRQVLARAAEHLDPEQMREFLAVTSA
jgi:hypothetical protein